jgi:isoquinoline 1-oxidoreductase subunit alpha
LYQREASIIPCFQLGFHFVDEFFSTRFESIELMLVNFLHSSFFSSELKGDSVTCLYTSNIMASLTLNINKKDYSIDVDPAMPLLWAIRDIVGLTGTKFGCGIAQCGACTVHLDGSPIRSCSFPVSGATGKTITTIEGVSPNRSHAIQKAWIQHQVPQCGYCQSGQIMSAVALLAKTPAPSDADIDAAMSGNICRCGTYQRIREAIKTASRELNTTA